MHVLTLAYQCCERMLPFYISHAKVEAVAAQAREQLVAADTDAVTLSVLRDIRALKINGIQFELWVDIEHTVNDEQGNPVLGVCEFDPAASMDATVLSVSPVSETASEELVLSTFAHELGHAIFDAPSWIAAAAKGPGLFDDPADFTRKAYRTTTTRDAEHLAKPAPTVEPQSQAARNSDLDRSVHFAELRANEFMGSLLVPRQHLYRAAEDLAPKHGVTIKRNPSLDPDSPGIAMQLTTRQGAFSNPNKMFELQQTLAKRFGVHRRFIQVRMERYGLLIPGI